MGWCRSSTLGIRRELSSRNVSEYDLDRMHLETSAASFTSFNSEEGFGSPAAHRNKDRPNVFDMDDNDLKVQIGVALHGAPCHRTLRHKSTETLQQESIVYTCRSSS